MKKTFLILPVLALISVTLQAQVTYETFRAQLEKSYQHVRDEAQMRDSVPILYVDTVHCVGYTTFPQYQINDETFQGWTYDADNKELENRIYQIYYSDQGNFEYRQRFNSFYDAEDRLASQFSYDVSNTGSITPVSKTEYEYNIDNRISSTVTSNWTGSDWFFSRRTLYAYDANGYQTELLAQDYDGLGWVNSNRQVSAYDAEGNSTYRQYSTWENNAWAVQSEYSATYDANGNLEEEFYSYGFNGNPLAPYSRYQYFNSNERVDSVYSYNYDTGLDTWVLYQKEYRVYDASGEWTESNYYTADGIGGFFLSNRSLYDFETTTFGFENQHTLNQTWDPFSMTFLDASENVYELQEYPGNLVAGYFRFSSQDPPGSGQWLVNFNCDLGYHFSYVTSAPQPADADNACTMPNPYTTGQWIQCDQLRDNYSYVAQVFSTDGRRVYARAFKGGNGWSIEKTLPEGIYAVVLTHNNKPVWKSKVVVRN